MTAIPEGSVRNIAIGAAVFTAKGARLGYVVDRNAYRVEVGDGFLFRRRYDVELEDMDRYEGGMLVLKVTADEVRGQGRSDNGRYGPR